MLRIEAGVRIYSAGDWRNGMLLIVLSAAAGWIATLLVKETGCRNIYSEMKK